MQDPRREICDWKLITRKFHRTYESHNNSPAHSTTVIRPAVPHFSKSRNLQENCLKETKRIEADTSIPRQFSHKATCRFTCGQPSRTERSVSRWTSREDAFGNPSATSEREDDLPRPSASQIVPGVAVITRYQCWFQRSFARWRYLSE